MQKENKREERLDKYFRNDFHDFNDLIENVNGFFNIQNFIVFLTTFYHSIALPMSFTYFEDKTNCISKMHNHHFCLAKV